jgi:hypothetical protein
MSHIPSLEYRGKPKPVHLRLGQALLGCATVQGIIRTWDWVTDLVGRGESAMDIYHYLPHLLRFTGNPLFFVLALIGGFWLLWKEGKNFDTGTPRTVLIHGYTKQPLRTEDRLRPAVKQGLWAVGWALVVAIPVGVILGTSLRDFVLVKPLPITVLSAPLPPAAESSIPQEKQPKNTAPFRPVVRPSKGPMVGPPAPAQARNLSVPLQTAPQQTQSSQSPSSGPPANAQNLTEGDRERLSNLTVDFARVLEEMSNLAYKANAEIGGVRGGIASGSLLNDYKGRIKALDDLTSEGKALASKFAREREQGMGKYYLAQTQTVFGDNPDNLGPNSILNSTGGLAAALEQWSTIQDRKAALPLLGTPLNEADEHLRTFFNWERGCEGRLSQLRQSLR